MLIVLTYLYTIDRWLMLMHKKDSQPAYVYAHTCAGVVLTTSCSLRSVSLSRNCRRTDRTKVHSRGRSNAE